MAHEEAAQQIRKLPSSSQQLEFPVRDLLLLFSSLCLWVRAGLCPFNLSPPGAVSAALSSELIQAGYLLRRNALIPSASALTYI